MALSRSELWHSLKEAGLTDRPYVNYKTPELQALYDQNIALSGVVNPELYPEVPVLEAAETRLAAAPEPPTRYSPPVVVLPDTVAGLRTNTHSLDEPLRVDENGILWFQDEVRKPAFPKPRGRRVLKYDDPGVKTVKVKSGQFTESFEMPGDGVGRPSEARITMPSYQVGIYKDPRLPFKIAVYNDQRGFDLFEVQKYYGGRDLVPSDIKRVYIENVLCYDIRTVVRAIETEYRERVLKRGAL